MPRKKPIKPCLRCGKLLPVNRKGHCEECAITRGIQAARQMHRRSGPFFDRWRAAMRRLAERS